MRPPVRRSSAVPRPAVHPHPSAPSELAARPAARSSARLSTTDGRRLPSNPSGGTSCVAPCHAAPGPARLSPAIVRFRGTAVPRNRAEPVAPAPGPGPCPWPLAPVVHDRTDDGNTVRYRHHIVSQPSHPGCRRASEVD
ncbi:hypothetical protein FRAAL1609 [Frankia alni ACN14a]|uniref:Uncharacterized protein n=1 Tax=Frankia alni (strain DSM 45986 / CECT 9034 / ACN14a) TaxID=326424 RepID=Q0RQB2_FRAAA|nr:hypothetical protein FRAAL1609 [Frankia alni ACN14a]